MEHGASSWQSCITSIGSKRYISLNELLNCLDKAFLFHLHQIGSFPPTLQEILCDDSILKVGRNIKNDRTILQQDHGFEMKGICDVGTLAKEKNQSSSLWPNSQMIFLDIH